MSKEGIYGSLDVLFDKMDGFLSSKTVVGEAIHIGDIVLLPLIEVSVGVGAGGNDKEGTESGAAGLGAKIVPSAVISINNGDISLISVKNQDALNKLVDMAPGILTKLGLGSLFTGKNKKDEKPEVVEEVIVDEFAGYEENPAPFQN